MALDKFFDFTWNKERIETDIKQIKNSIFSASKKESLTLEWKIYNCCSHLDRCIDEIDKRLEYTEDKLSSESEKIKDISDDIHYLKQDVKKLEEAVEQIISYTERDMEILRYRLQRIENLLFDRSE